MSQGKRSCRVENDASSQSITPRAVLRCGYEAEPLHEDCECVSKGNFLAYADAFCAKAATGDVRRTGTRAVLYFISVYVSP